MYIGLGGHALTAQIGDTEIPWCFSKQTQTIPLQIQPWSSMLQSPSEHKQHNLWLLCPVEHLLTTFLLQIEYQTECK